MEIRIIDNSIRSHVINLIKENWGSGIIVVKGRVHNIDILPGFVVLDENKIVGLITYNIENEECEIVSIDSFIENRGIGTKLVEKVVETAQKKGCRRVWLITTNDNLNAIRFYQRKGFNMKDIYVNAVNEARKIKPEIPKIGEYNIPIMHEIEFEKIIR